MGGDCTAGPPVRLSGTKVTETRIGLGRTLGLVAWRESRSKWFAQVLGAASEPRTVRGGAALIDAEGNLINAFDEESEHDGAWQIGKRVGGKLELGRPSKARPLFGDPVRLPLGGVQRWSPLRGEMAPLVDLVAVDPEAKADSGAGAWSGERFGVLYATKAGSRACCGSPAARRPSEGRGDRVRHSQYLAGHNTIVQPAKTIHATLRP